MENFYEINYENNMKSLNLAFEYCNTTFSDSEIFEILKGNDAIKKQLCLLELTHINSQDEADILVLNLTNQSGPVRETASYKILDLIKITEYNKFFQTPQILDNFIKAITDINPSVSRNAVEIIKYVKHPQYIYESLIKSINLILEKHSLEAKNRSYVQNKKNFALYWSLEAIISLGKNIAAGEELINILNITAKSNDYTIREKTAKAASIFNFTNILELLKNDTNIYVQNNLMV